MLRGVWGCDGGDWLSEVKVIGRGFQLDYLLIKVVVEMTFEPSTWRVA